VGSVLVDAKRQKYYWATLFDNLGIIMQELISRLPWEAQ